MANHFPPDMILQLAQSLISGAQCYIRRKDNAVSTFPADESLMEMLEPEQAAKMQKELRKIRRNETQYISITPPSGYQLFSMMEDFLRVIQDSELRARLRHSLQLMKPIPLYKEIIEASRYAAAWKEFQEKRYTEWVEKQIRLQSFPDVDDIMQQIEK